MAPPGEPRTKPRALNVALPLARGRVHGRLRRRGRARSRPVAARRRGLRARPARRRLPAGAPRHRQHRRQLADAFFTIEYAALFDVMQPRRWRSATCPVPLGGTSNHFRDRRPARPRTAGTPGTSPRTPISASGSRSPAIASPISPSATLEEAPATVRAWLKQRTRWMKGYMQTCITHGRRPAQALRALGLPRFIAAR